VGTQKRRQPDVRPTQSADRVVVRVKNGARERGGALRELLESLPESTAVVRDVDRTGMAVLQLPPGSDVSKVVDDLKSNPVVLYAEPLFLDYGSR
jgi:hypothetical protein